METRFFNSLLLVIMGLLAVSCSKEAAEPEIQFSADRVTISANDTVTFTIAGSAAGLSIYAGDAGHKFEDSYLAVTSGKDIETETVYLTPEKFQELKNSAIVSEPAIIDSIETLVGIKYKGRSHPSFLITLFYNYEVAAAKVAEIIDFFTLENKDYTPEDGFSTGAAIDVSARNKVYQHIYTTPGVYTATLVAVNVGRKNLKDSNRGLPSSSDYDSKYITKTIKITVQ